MYILQNSSLNLAAVALPSPHFSFESLNPDKVREAFMAGNYQVKMDYQEVIQLAELKYSPFKDRICRVSLVLSVCFS